MFFRGNDHKTLFNEILTRERSYSAMCSVIRVIKDGLVSQGFRAEDARNLKDLGRLTASVEVLSPGFATVTQRVTASIDGREFVNFIYLDETGSESVEINL